MIQSGNSYSPICSSQTLILNTCWTQMPAGCQPMAPACCDSYPELSCLQFLQLDLVAAHGHDTESSCQRSWQQDYWRATTGYWTEHRTGTQDPVYPLDSNITQRLHYVCIYLTGPRTKDLPVCVGKGWAQAHFTESQGAGHTKLRSL